MQMNNQEPLLYMQPKFNPMRYFLDRHALTLFSMIILMIISLNVSISKVENLPLYCVIIIICYILYVVLKGFKIKKQYKLVEYQFYDDRVIVLNDNKKAKDVEILYSDIVDVLLMQNYVQRFFDEGDFIIKLSEGKVFAKTVSLISVGNFAKNTKKVSQIIYG